MRPRVAVAAVGVVAVVTVGSVMAASSYAAPCTANTDTCRQQRIVALEKAVASLEAAQSPSPTATPSPSATVTPTPTPTEAPAPSAQPLTAPAGWDLAAANTGLAGAGVDRTKLPVYTGAIVSGQTLSLVQITHAVDLSAVHDVTLDRVWIHPTSGTSTLFLGFAANITVKDSDLDGPAAGSTDSSVVVRGYGPTGYNLLRLNVTGGSVGVWIDGDGTGTLAGTYVHGLRSSGSHVDGFTRRVGTGPLTITGSRIDANVNGSTTGAFFLQDTDSKKVGGITVADTLFEGIGYVMTLENRSGAGTSVALNRVRVRLSTPNYYGYLTTFGTITTPTWTDVRVYDPTQPDAAGPPIARP